MSIWKKTIKKITDGMKVNANSVNTSINDLEMRTNYLKECIDTLIKTDNIALQIAELSFDVLAGHVVYFDKEINGCSKAKAAWKNKYGPNGELLVSEQSKVYGIVTEKTTAISGTIVIEGITTLTPQAMSTLFGNSSPAIGTYYLDAINAGTVTTAAPAMSVAVVMYIGNNTIKILPPVYPNHTHIHKVFELEGSWLPITDSQFDEMDKPAGALLGYDIEGEPLLKELFNLVVGDITCSYDNKINELNTFVSTEHNIWSTLTNINKQVTAYVTIPLSHGQPIIRALKTNTPKELALSALNGVATLDLQPWIEDPSDYPDYSSTAISNLNGRMYQKTKNISALLGGAGTTVSVDSKGRATIGLTQFTEAPQMPDIINLNNAMHTTEDTITYLTFPEGRDASLIGTFSLGLLPEGHTHKAYPFVSCKGLSNNGYFPAITIKKTFIASAEPNGALDISSNTIEVETVLPGFGSLSTNKYNKIDEVGIDVLAGGMLYVSLFVNASSQNKQLYKFGIVIKSTPI